MVNPSINGWIDKFFNDYHSNIGINNNAESFYLTTRKTGFIFGYITSFDNGIAIDTSNWLTHEISKIALLNTLFNAYCINNSKPNIGDFIEKAVSFYDIINNNNSDFVDKIATKNSTSYHLEKIIHARVQTNESVLTNKFSYVVTNALLFVDVLAFNQYLIHKTISNDYLKKIEDAILTIVSLALKTKGNKSPHDDLLLKLLESSVHYTKFSNANIQNFHNLNFDYFTDTLDKKYIIDLAGLSLWSDGIIEKNEAYFLYKLAEKINISDDFVAKSMFETNEFISKYKAQIPYFNYSNPVKSFYDQTTQTVIKLILRNKKRLVKEISESKELMILLAKSTQRDLDATEKKKVKAQLLDICKTVPSLTIFLIPGGSLLLPLLIKFIPQLLPSSFNENLED